MRERDNKINYIVEEYKEYIEHLDEKKRIYIEKRLLNQISWYDRKAIEKNKIYKIMTIISILTTAAIPVFSLYTGFKYGIVASTIIALLSATSSVIISIINLCEYQRLWIQYRSNCEILKSILHRFFTNSGEFTSSNDDENFKMLIQMSEEYLLKEFQTWRKLPHACEKE